MTTAGGDSGSAPGGMDYGPDYAAARLSVEIPDEAIQGVREITQHIEKFRVALESATHTEADFNRYLDDMAQATKLADEAQQHLTQSLMNYISMTSRMTGAPSMGVPGGGFQQPFAGSTPFDLPPTRPPNPSDVMSQLKARAEGGEAGPFLNMAQQRGAMTGQDAVDISAQSIQALANKIAEREQANMVQQKLTDGNAIEPPAPTGGMQERIQRATGLAGQVSNEMAVGGGGGGGGAAGGSVTGVGRMVQRALGGLGGMLGGGGGGGAEGEGPPPQPGAERSGGQGGGITVGGPPARSHEQEDAQHPSSEAPPQEGGGGGLGGLGGLAGLAGGLGKLTGAVGLAVTAFEGFHKAGQAIQGARNIGSLRGGAGGEGAIAEARATKLAALNPFLSQDQARQIYQSVMSEGYADASGGGADNVIDFMKSNMEHMNISVADSAKMLNATVVGSGRGDKEGVAGSIKMLSTELDNIRNMSAKGVMSQPEYRERVMNLQEAMENQGASPEMAAKQAMILTQQGSNDRLLKGQYAQIGTDIQGNVGAQMQIRAMGGVNVPAGVLPTAMGDYLSDTGQEGRGMENMMKVYAMRAHQRYPGNDEVSKVNAVALFKQFMKSVDPSSEAANSTPKARALMADLLQDQSYNQAQQEVESHPQASTGLESQAGAVPSAAPAQGGPGAESTQGAPQQGGGGMAGKVGSVVHNVTVGLTSEAAKIFQVVTQSKTPQIATNEAQAKQGRNGAAMNNP